MRFVSKLGVFFLIALTACGTKASVEQAKPPVVFTRQLGASDLFELLNYPARIEAKVNATVLSETDGVVTQINTSLGKRVFKNQRLMLLSHTDPVYQYAPVEILSPIQGLVSSLEVTPGSHVTRGQKLISVIDPSRVEVSIEVPVQDLAVLKKGVIGDFKTSALEPTFQVKVSGMSPFVDPMTGTALAKLELVSTSQGIVSPGMQGQVSFRVNQHRGYSVPDSAVVYQGKSTFVRIIEQNKVKMIPVVLGRKQRGNVEVTQGLNSDVILVERSSRFVSDGELVTVESAQKL